MPYLWGPSGLSFFWKGVLHWACELEGNLFTYLSAFYHFVVQTVQLSSEWQTVCWSSNMTQTCLLCREGEEFVRHDIIQPTDRLPVFSVQPLLYVMLKEKQTIRLSACEKRLMCFKFRVEVLLETTNPEPYSGPETQDCGIVVIAHHCNQSHKLRTQNVGKWIELLHKIIWLYITVLFSCAPIRIFGADHRLPITGSSIQYRSPK